MPAQRYFFLLTTHLGAILSGCPDAHFVQMSQQIGRILVNAISARLFELILAIAAGEQANSERPGAARGQEIPDAVPDYNRIANIDVQTRRRREKQIRVGFGVTHLIPSDDWDFRSDSQRL